MGYNVIDLINKSINIAERKKEVYENIRQHKSNVPSIKIMVTVLIEQVDKNIIYYDRLKNELADRNFHEIDFLIYDKISSLIDEFNKKLSEPSINNARNFLEFSLELEKNIYSLFIDIQGRCVKNAEDVNSETYKILGNIIDNKAKLITMLEDVIQGI